MKYAKTLAIIILGNFILAFATSAFILPFNIAGAGTTGLALFLNGLCKLDVTIGVYILNISFFILGYLTLGKRFAITTLISTFVYPFALSIFTYIPMIQTLSDNILLAALFAGPISGIGIGLVLKEGASTGGMDIPPCIMHKYFGFSISVMIYIFDFLILLLQFPYFGSVQILYGILNLFLMTVFIDKVMIIGKKQVQLIIISKKYEEIRRELLKLDYGITLLEVETGLLKQKQKAVLSVVTHRKLPMIQTKVQEIDPQAFMMIDTITEVRGKGFTMEKEYHEIIE